MNMDPDYVLTEEGGGSFERRRRHAMQRLVAIRTDGEYCHRGPIQRWWWWWGGFRQQCHADCKGSNVARVLVTEPGHSRRLAGADVVVVLVHIFLAQSPPVQCSRGCGCLRNNC